MSIKYIVGNPGSGKSYFAVHEIYTKSNNYDFVYTNINGFDFDAFNNVKLFSYNSIMEHLSYLHSVYINFQESNTDQSNSNVDLELINYSKKHNLHKCLFVIDEVHNVFKDKNNEVIIWWLTYHRHLFADFILITQDLSLVHNEYKRIAEFFYRAVDGPKRLFQSKLKYIQYSNYRMYQNSIIKGGGVSLKKDPTIYKIYHSGEYKKSSSFIVKYLILLAFLLLLISYFFYDFLNIFSNKDDQSKLTSNPHQTQKIKNANELTNDDFFKIPNKPNENRSKNNKTLTDEIEQYAYYISCINENCFIGKEYNLIPYAYVQKLFLELKPYVYRYVQSPIYEIKYMAIFDSDVFEKFRKRKEEDEDEEFNTLNSSSTYTPKFPTSIK